MEQRTEEWFQARLGHVTASRIGDMMARTQKGEWGASRRNYAAELIAERLTGTPTTGYVSPAMQHGIDTEPQALVAYEFYRDVSVVPVGYVLHPSIAESGASPDGFVGEHGLVECKCPNTATHIETLDGAKIPQGYQLQMQWQMAVTGRQWVDFISFDPRMPESMRLHIQRVHRDEDVITDLEAHVTHFLKEIRGTVERLRARYEAPLNVLMAGE